MRIFNCVLFCLLFIILLFSIEFTSRLSEMEKEAERYRTENQSKINELEKEIRLLKQDLIILENGYEWETETETQF